MGVFIHYSDCSTSKESDICLLVAVVACVMTVDVFALMCMTCACMPTRVYIWDFTFLCVAVFVQGEKNTRMKP